MISVAPIATISWVCDTRLVSYAMEQAGRLISHARANEVMHNFAWTPLYNIYNQLSSLGPGQSPISISKVKT